MRPAQRALALARLCVAGGSLTQAPLPLAAPVLSSAAASAACAASSSSADGAAGRSSSNSGPSARGLMAAALAAGCSLAFLNVSTTIALAEAEADPAAGVPDVEPETAAAAAPPSMAPSTAGPPPSAGGPSVPLPLSGPFQLVALPYDLDALEPFMGASTLAVHHGKHHRTYLDNLNKQIAGSALEQASLQDVVISSWNGGKPTPAFNNAAQSWNHELFWSCMKPGGGGEPPAGPLADAITRDFGSLTAFKAAFKAAGLGQFGSGWVWLISDHDGKLSIVKTGNAATPMVTGWHCVLVADVWEHAYYLDYQNRRGDFLDAYLEHLVDWGAAAQRYEAVLNAPAEEEEEE